MFEGMFLQRCVYSHARGRLRLPAAVRAVPAVRRAPPDTFRHRLWECQCPDVVELRNSIAPLKIQEWASKDDDNLAVFGVLPHPGDGFPAPLDKKEAFRWNVFRERWVT